jgi:tetratricopeptide (TPR) repeat protein
MAAEEHESKKIINQASDFVTQTSKNLPRNEMQSQMTIINARLHLLKDDKTKAKELIETLNEDNYDNYSLEDLLDKAKAYHDLGLHDQSLDLMGEIEARCHKDDSQGALFMHYVKKEKAEKTDIKLPPRALNNQAVERYERGDIDAALQSFKQALTTMPKSAAIALNLLQTLVLKSKDKGVHKENEDIVNRCIKTISDGRLNPEQHERYQKVKSLLTQMNYSVLL